MKKKVQGDMYICKGTVYRGDVNISGNLYMQKEAQVFGNVNAEKVYMDEGSYIEGEQIWTQKIIMHKKASFSAKLIADEVQRIPNDQEDA